MVKTETASHTRKPLKGRKPMAHQSVRTFLRRPRSAWSLYLKALKSENSDMPLLEVVQLASPLWKAMSSSDKAKFQAKHDSELAKYKESKANLTPEQAKAVRAHRKKLRNDPRRVRRAPTSYMNFIKANKEGFKTSGKNMIDYSRELTQKWKAMTDSEKHQF